MNKKVLQRVDFYSKKNRQPSGHERRSTALSVSIRSVLQSDQMPQ